MNSDRVYSITKEDFKTLDTEDISEIVLKNGTILKFKPNSTTSNVKTCTCYKTRNMASNMNYKDNKSYNKYVSFTQKNKYNNNLNGFYVTPIPNREPKLIAIKLPHYEEPKKIKYNIKTFTFESEPKKYKYKPYKLPKRKHVSRTKYTGYKNLNKCTCFNKNNGFICTCGKFKKY